MRPDHLAAYVAADQMVAAASFPPISAVDMAHWVSSDPDIARAPDHRESRAAVGPGRQAQSLFSVRMSFVRSMIDGAFCDARAHRGVCASQLEFPGGPAHISATGRPNSRGFTIRFRYPICLAARVAAKWTYICNARPDLERPMSATHLLRKTAHLPTPVGRRRATF